ncbi:hypothetical protein [Paenibacillus protaetiae]|uniref:O-antigen ligase domain-containing protein n=1 Tax=Paenibacillus protaetiae TaxID=2509456 RepID=A0A4P6EXI4_9BACL|nr:hypothetical protein [Paenibacillus protaetiae]QAY67784.1 hypothetical protein ET464_16705 [Paenibacillus protaetiae]
MQIYQAQREYEMNHPHKINIIALLIFLSICSIYAINDQKTLVYSLRILFIVIMMIRIITHGIKVNWYIVWVSSFLTICTATILWSNDQEKGLYSLVWSVQVFLVTVFIGDYIDSREKRDFLIKCISAGGVLLTIRLMIATPITVWGTGRLGLAIGYNVNDVGLKLSFSVLCLIYLIKNGEFKRYKKIILFCLTLILITVTLFTGSKKAFLVILIGVSLFTLLSVKKISKTFIILPFLLIFIYGFYYAVMNFQPLYNVLGERVEAMVVTLSGVRQLKGLVPKLEYK